MVRHSMIFIAMICTGLAVSGRVHSQDVPAAPIAVGPVHGWTNVFAGTGATLDCQVTSQAASAATLYWSVSIDRAVIARGEQALNLEANRRAEIPLKIDFPELKPGLVAPASLTLEIRTQGGLRAQRIVALHVFSPDVSTNRGQWLKSLEIHLFDPARKTGEVMESSRIPFRICEGPDGRPGTNGVIIHGAGLETARQPVAWEAAINAAASGRRVIVLGSSGSVPLAGLFTANNSRSTSVALRRGDLIRDLDKRLDATDWPLPGRLIASSLHWSVKGESPVVEFRDDPAGWAWLDVRYPTGGRLIWTGIGMIESWETTPAARYLFVKLLEEMMIEKPELGGPKHAAQ